MKLMIEGAMQENRGPHWIWKFEVAVLIEVDSIVVLSLLRKMGSSVLREEVMFWIVCGISVVVAVSSAVVDFVDDDESVSDLPLPCLSPVSARALVMGREFASMAVPAVY